MADTIIKSLEQKEQLLSKQLSNLDGVIVAYSGGVDSSLLAYYARAALGDKAKIAIAVSPTLASDELEAARLQAEQFNLDLIEVEVPEVEDPEYMKNDTSRCYHCKRTIFTQLEELARETDVKYIAYGAIVDDMQDTRSGNRAAREHRVLSPLQHAGLEKWEIRQLALKIGLPSWNRPQAACLSSRLPLNEPVTLEKLSLIEKSEAYLHSLGFRQLRVRHHGEIARIELEQSEMPKLCGNVELMAQVAAMLRELGYRFVTIDLSGYKARLPENTAREDSRAGL
jgi:pyridinium-3,5-biscarboxylic acid mononucleotide sulfurtransferase